MHFFFVRVEVRAWFMPSEAMKETSHDFLFMFQLINYQDIEPEINKATAKKFTIISII